MLGSDHHFFKKERKKEKKKLLFFALLSPESEVFFSLSLDGLFCVRACLAPFS